MLSGVATVPARNATAINPRRNPQSPTLAAPGNTRDTGTSRTVAATCTDAARHGPSQVPLSNAAAVAKEKEPSV